MYFSTTNTNTQNDTNFYNFFENACHFPPLAILCLQTNLKSSTNIVDIYDEGHAVVCHGRGISRRLSFADRMPSFCARAYFSSAVKNGISLTPMLVLETFSAFHG